MGASKKHPAEQGGTSTRAVHGGARARRGEGGAAQPDYALAAPLHQTSTFWFENSAQLRAYAEGQLPRDEYGRYSNPTWRAVERKLAALEGAEAVALTGSGMAAATTTFLALLQRGDHIVLTNDCYRRTRQFVQQVLTKLEVQASVIEPADVAALQKALRPNTRFFFTESPTNPYLRVIDLPAAAQAAHEVGALVLVDSTFATPLNFAPLNCGADLVLHSGTKYFGGHNDLLAGVIAGPQKRVQPIRELVGVMGGVLDPHAAWLLLRGLKTLALRMARHNENGQRVAEMLEAHNKVRRVWYPGLQSHPDFATAAALMKGFGGVVTFTVAGDFAATVRFTDACRLPYLAPSLGGVESLIEMPVLMSYWDTPPAQRKSYGISDNLVRLACGIEDADDLIADLQQALAQV